MQLSNADVMVVAVVMLMALHWCQSCIALKRGALEVGQTLFLISSLAVHIRLSRSLTSENASSHPCLASMLV